MRVDVPEPRLQDQGRIGADEHGHRAAPARRPSGARLVDGNVPAHHQGVAPVPLAAERKIEKKRVWPIGIDRSSAGSSRG